MSNCCMRRPAKFHVDSAVFELSLKRGHAHWKVSENHAPWKGGQILPLPAISASIRARITKLGKREDMLVNFMVCNFGDLGSIF